MLFSAMESVKGGRDLRAVAVIRENNLLTITLEEASTGVEKEVTIKHDVLCPHCNGEKAEPGSHVETCPTCGGSGQVKQVRSSLFGLNVETVMEPVK